MDKAGTVRPAYSFYRFVWTCLDWLYPPKCGGCGAVGQRWCGNCLSSSRQLGDAVCAKCGTPLNNGGVCRSCLSQPPAYTALRSWAVFEGPLRNAMHRLKYKRDIAQGEALCQPMIPFLACQGWALDMVAPVPLGAARLHERGYNQAGLIALPVAVASGLPYQPGAIAKLRDTATQVGLSREERRLNVAGAFRGNNRFVRGKNVLVVDDVTTTGATIQACAEALLQAGASQVYGLTLARAVRLTDHQYPVR